MPVSITEYGEAVVESLTETGETVNGAITEVGAFILKISEPIAGPKTRLFLLLGDLAIQLTGD